MRGNFGRKFFRLPPENNSPATAASINDNLCTHNKRPSSHSRNTCNYNPSDFPSFCIPYSPGLSTNKQMPPLTLCELTRCSLCRLTIPQNTGPGWSRTNVGLRQWVYSPSPLATRAPTLLQKSVYLFFACFARAICHCCIRLARVTICRSCEQEPSDTS